MRTEPYSSTQVLERSAILLDVLSMAKEPMTLSHVAAAAKLPVSTTHRLLNSMWSFGYVQQNQKGRWELGLRLFELGRKVYDRQDLRQYALPVMVSLQTNVPLNIYLGIRHHNQFFVIEELCAPDMVVRSTTHLGKPTPLHSIAGGKLFLARNNPIDFRQYIEDTPMERITEHSLLRQDELLVQLSRIREYGWASEREERQVNVVSVAVPIIGNDGKMLAALCAESRLPRDISHLEIHYLVNAGKAIGMLLRH